MGGGTPPWHDDRPRLRLDRSARPERRWRSSTCPGTSGSCPTCWPEWDRCRPRCSWSPPTRAGCRSPANTSLRWMRWACATVCLRSPAAISPIRAPATARAVAEISGTSLGEVEAVAVSAPAGTGLPALRAALDRLLARLPTPDVDAPVRLWIDRCFTVRGSGTVVTGTLAAGRLEAGDELELAPGSGTRPRPRSSDARSPSRRSRAQLPGSR